MTTIAIDNETFLIEPGQLAPKLVCVSWFGEGIGGVFHVRDVNAYNHVKRFLSGATLVGQNIPFDLAVWANEWPDLLPLIFQAYEEDRVVDTMTRQKLIDIARGEYRGYRDGLTGKWIEYKYHLADLARRHKYEVDLDKDTWRLRYSELYDVDVKDWPQDAYDYSYHDARSTYHVWSKQEDDHQFLADQHRQARAHWALHLCSTWGIRTDKIMVGRLERLTIDLLRSHEEYLFRKKLLERDKKGKIIKKMKRAQEHAEMAWGNRSDKVLTDGGKASLSEEAAERLGDPLITAFQQYSSASTLMQRIEELKQGIDKPIHTRFDELMDTGRTSSSKPNIQNRQVKIVERNGERAGDRECFVPRRGNVFYITDVPGLELRTIAQKCISIIGYSRLGEILREKGDPHAAVGANLLGISYEEFIKRKKNPNDEEAYLNRQTGKIVNFGLDALLGWRGLIAEARSKYKVVFTEQQAKRAIEVYYITYPEMKEYHEWVKATCGRAGVATISHLFSDRYRGLCPPTVLSNTFSQGLGADATKAALFPLARACYLPGDDLLYGCRLVNYVHDEYNMEGPEDDYIVQRANRYSNLLCSHINEWLPDVQIDPQDFEVVITRRWSKLAKREPEGRVWEWEEARVAGSPGFAE